MNPGNAFKDIAAFLHEKLYIKSTDSKDIELFVQENRHQLLTIYLADEDCDTYGLIESLVRVANAKTAVTAAKSFSDVAEWLTVIDDKIAYRLMSDMKDIEFEEGQ